MVGPDFVTPDANIATANELSSGEDLDLEPTIAHRLNPLGHLIATRLEERKFGWIARRHLPLECLFGSHSPR